MSIINFLAIRKKMSSIINGQRATIQQLITPEGINIATGPPSLTPYSGALAYDPTTIAGGSLFIGTGSDWLNVAGGSGISGISTSVSVLLTASGQPNITGTLYLQRLTIGTISMVYFQLTLNEAITITNGTTWAQSAVVPSGYIPLQTSGFANVIQVTGGNLTAASSYMTIDTAGDIFMGLGTMGTVILVSVSGNYIV